MEGSGYRVSVENVYTRLTGAVEFSSLNRLMTNLESVVVLEEKTSVRVKVVLGISAAFAFGGEVSSSVVKVFRRETLNPKEETGKLCMRAGSVPPRTGGIQSSVV